MRLSNTPLRLPQRLPRFIAPLALAAASGSVHAQPCADWIRRDLPGPGRRYSHVMVFDEARGVTVLFGGDAIPGCDVVWEYDGVNWTPRDASGPTCRADAGAAFDRTRGVMVLRGGWSSDALETWEWDGAAWTLRDSDLGPGYLGGPRLTYDDARDKILLFGGSGGMCYNRQLWSWDGMNWTIRDDGVPGPGYRGAFTMAFDAARGVAVVFGGYESDTACEPNSAVSRRDTWEWDGGSWLQVATGGPAGAHYGAMTYDTQRERILLFGGYQNDFSDEMWEWDSVEWRMVHVGSARPSGRAVTALVYDTIRGVLVLYGGLSAEGAVDEATWELRFRGPTPGCPADLDGDDSIGLGDLTLLLSRFGLATGATACDGDLDADGDVDLSDLAALLAAFGDACP